MPVVEIIDLRTYVPDGDAMLSAPLRAAIGETLAAGDQTILFLNRRGFATFVLCKACGHAFRCPHCSVSLTYHRHSDRLSCHYCGFQQRVPETCPGCGTAACRGAVGRILECGGIVCHRGRRRLRCGRGRLGGGSLLLGGRCGLLLYDLDVRQRVAGRLGTLLGERWSGHDAGNACHERGFLILQSPS